MGRWKVIVSAATPVMKRLVDIAGGDLRPVAGLRVLPGERSVNALSARSLGAVLFCLMSPIDASRAVWRSGR